MSADKFAALRRSYYNKIDANCYRLSIPSTADAPYTGGFGRLLLDNLELELKPGKRIVQAWRSQGWAKGYYSIVTFALSKKSDRRTRLRFTQIGVPASDYAKKNRGWYEHYWEPLKRFLEK